MESALLAWLTAHQDRINLSENLVREHAEQILDRLHPGHEPFQFSNGWLKSFIARNGIRSYRRFGESGSMDMIAVEDALSSLHEILSRC